MVAGRNPVVESLRAQVPAMALYVSGRAQQDERIAEAVQLAADAGIAVLEAGLGELDRLTGGAVHQGVALRVRPYEYAHPDDFTQQLTAPPLIVALDGVTDPRNLGAVVRSAAAFGATGVVVPARRSAGVTAGAWKASAGAIARLPVARATNLTRTLEAYKERGLFVAGLDAAGTTGVGDMTIADGPMVLVVGSEGRGLSRVVAGACDMLVRIPMSESTESLNAGVAGSIALYEIARARARQP
jgi:23S rRNA (guanosine2251-2'-O)-methyltransferase